MTFVTTFLWYVVAFGLGSLVSFVAAARMVAARSEHEAFADLDAAGYGDEYDVDHHPLDGENA